LSELACGHLAFKLNMLITHRVVVHNYQYFHI
jgi:hypothetical protein